ncbi:MAG: aminoglycoside phosphotransferase family protein [Nitrospira sp.]|nr:MAG: Phosphotransferase enzyme family protein [Nitrospira sp. OLB3]MCE7966528.1 aminoglycoside phosphotransferase family protein [Nitrospira sp. NTP2]MCK6492236.1 aminoglycoside phosphotransferase family protein [Nitrospira sp.]MEB2339078.1 phosphotransferase [Nitrospirales bacterium]QOJ35980.1 MAG: phosphotransferase [Nitrospira sp.]
MAVLKKSALERYLRDRFGPSTEVLAYGPIGKETSGAQYKQYGYGAPVRLTFRVEGQVRQAVLGTMSPGPFGHEHPADRAQAMLWDYACYSRLPKHIAALDVGAFTARNDLMSVAAAKEFFLLTQWSEGETYNKDLERLAQAAKPTAMDRKRVTALADYLATIHRVKHRDPQLYRRRLRELLGHGECIMGLTDSYPDRFAFISQELLESIETACNRWRWRLRAKHARLSQVHGDFHPWNVLFRRGTDFSVLDRSRGEWGEPADDVTSMSINYLFFSLCRHGTLTGSLETLFQSFWERYLTQSGDRAVLETTAPFFAFRGLVLASPLWYPKLSVGIRRKIFRFIENVLAADRFDPADVKRYYA